MVYWECLIDQIGIRFHNLDLGTFVIYAKSLQGLPFKVLVRYELCRIIGFCWFYSSSPSPPPNVGVIWPIIIIIFILKRKETMDLCVIRWALGRCKVPWSLLDEAEEVLDLARKWSASFFHVKRLRKKKKKKKREYIWTYYAVTWSAITNAFVEWRSKNGTRRWK